MSGGKASRDKGNRSERELVKILREAGLEARRVPLSGACEGYKDDVLWRIPLERIRVGQSTQWNPIEAKVRKNGFKQLYAWLPEAGVLAVKSDRNEWLVVEKLSDWIKRLA